MIPGAGLNDPHRRGETVDPADGYRKLRLRRLPVSVCEGSKHPSEPPSAVGHSAKARVFETSGSYYAAPSGAQIVRPTALMREWHYYGQVPNRGSLCRLQWFHPATVRAVSREGYYDFKVIVD